MIEDVRSLEDVRKIDSKWLKTFGRWLALKTLIETAYANNGFISLTSLQKIGKFLRHIINGFRKRIKFFSGNRISCLY